MRARLPVTLLVIAAGGVAGALARAALTALAGDLWTGGTAIGTLVVNVVGAFAIGMIGSLAAGSSAAWWVRPFAITGVLGGFTTFSAYALEAAGLLETAPATALLYIVGSVLLGLAGVRLGMRVVGAA